MRYFILGSCVTRDIFRVVNEGEIADYYARTTLKSLVSKPVRHDQIHLESDFQKRVVERDFDKTLFYDLKKQSFDILIIDLIDERFDVMQLGRKKYITRSVEYVRANLDDKGHRIQKSVADWEKDCKKFTKKLLAVVQPEKIVIHKAYWAKEYIDNGKIKQYDNQEAISYNNKLLKHYYSMLESSLNAKVINPNKILGASDHMWGLTPFHYTDDYYYDVYNQLITY